MLPTRPHDQRNLADETPSVGERSMRRRKATGIAALALGVVLLIAGVIDHQVVASKSALCQSGLGQLGQALDDTVAHDCGLVTALESAVGWFLAVGVLALILGGVVLYHPRPLPAPPRPPPLPPRPAPLPRRSPASGKQPPPSTPVTMLSPVVFGGMPP